MKMPRGIYSFNIWFKNSLGFKCILILILDGLEEHGEVNLPKPSTSAFLVLLPFLIVKYAPYSRSELIKHDGNIKN